MEYPNSRFTRPGRLALLFLAIGCFIVATPIVILITAGYRYDWAAGLLKETGSISVDVEPTIATISLNDIHLKGALPLRLNNITPRRYTLAITAPGYFDWRKDIEVSSRQTTYIKEIRLLKKNIPERLSADSINALSLSPDGQYLLFSAAARGQTTLVLWPLGGGATSTLLQTAGNQPINIRWQSERPFAAIATGTEPFGRVSVLNINAGPILAEVNLPSAATIKKFVWDTGARRLLFLSASSTLWSFDAETRQLIKVWSGQFLDWHVADGAVWLLQRGLAPRSFKIVRDALGFSEDFATLTLPEEYGAEIPKLQAAEKHQALLIFPASHRSIIVTPKKNFTVAADNFVSSPFNAWWLLWSPWELWSYSAGDEPQLLNRFGVALKTVVPLDEFNTLGLVLPASLVALFPYYGVNLNWSEADIALAVADPRHGRLFFAGLNKQSPGLWQLNY